MVRARAPVRIDFAGGWTDVALFAQETPGAVVNAAISIYSYASVRRDQEDRARSGIKIYAADFDLYIEAADIRRLEYDGNADLVKAAIRHLNVDESFLITTRSDAPPGSGLGTSAGMGVALIGALSHLVGRPLLDHEVAELASEIEREELHILGGKQDQYASALGGIQFMEFFGETVRAASLRLAPATEFALQKHLVLCYTEQPRLSGDIHQRVTDAFRKGEAATTGAIANLKRIAREMKDALLLGDLGGFARLMSDNWENQKRLHPSVTNARMDELFAIAAESGAEGGKACGAGGGGCLVFLAQPDREHLVRQALKEAGARVLDFVFDHRGLQVI
ncbi:MAG TPA: GHMP kinase [Planctomycetota bacterium]|nr:GHMP kinase [Planctomycetota bacterium]